MRSVFDIGQLSVDDEVTFTHSSGEVMTGKVTNLGAMGGVFVFVTYKGPKGTAYRVTSSMIESIKALRSVRPR
jgi:hypothetical protein